MRRDPLRHHSALFTFGLYGIWLGLIVLSAWLAWQLHVTLIYLATLWLNSDLPRPPTWTANQLVGISKASVFGFGSLWLIWITYLEYDLRRHAARRLAARSLQIALILAAILLLTYALIWLTS